MKIPKYANNETRWVAAKIIAQQLIDDAGVRGDVDLIADDVAKYCLHGDGFTMAGELERIGWECNLLIAEVLDNFCSIIDRVHAKCLAKFAEDNAIEPPFPVGSRVSFLYGKTGIITEIFAKRPFSYLVQVEGDERAEPPTNSRLILWFDEVSAITTTGDLT